MKKIILIGSVSTAVIAIVTFMLMFSKTIVSYADLPVEVTQLNNQVVDIKDYIKEQQIENKLMQKIVAKQEADTAQVNQDTPTETILSPDGKWRWDEELKQWKEIKHEHRP